MNQRFFTTLRIGALAAALAAAGCHGGASGNALPPHSGTQSAALKLTVTKSSAQPASRPARSPQLIPNNAQSVSAAIYVGSASSGSAVSATCAAFTGGTSATLSLTAPYGTDTLVVQSWSGPCNSGATIGTGSVLTSFTGTGTVNAPTGDAGKIFGGSSGTITLSAPAPLSNVQFTNLGPLWQSVLDNTTISGDLAGSGKIQTVVPIGATSASAPASVIYIAGGDGNGFEVNTSSGIYKTTNAGSSWSPIGYDNGLVDTRVNDLYVFPGATTSQDVVLAATQFGGIYRSIDGGASFTNVSSTAGAVHFAAIGGTLYAVDSRGVEMSTNQGASWSLFQPIAQANALASTPSELVAGDQNGNIYVYSVTSATWTGPVAVAPSAVGCTTGPPSPGGIHTLVIDPNNANVIWATAWSCTLGGNAVSQELYLSQNAGATWAHVTSASTSTTTPNGTPTGWYGAQMIAPSVAFNDNIYVGAEFEQWSVTPGTPPVFTPVGGQSSQTIGSTYGDMRGLTVVSNGSGGDACYIASDQGLYFQGTCGRTGSSTVLPRVLTAGLSTNYLYGFGVGGSVGSEELLTTDQDFGPALGTNGGGTVANWSGTFNGTAGSQLGEGGDAEIAPNDPSKCLIANNPGSLGLAYSTDGCKTFTASTGSTALVNATSMTFDRKTAGTVYVAAGTSGLLVSRDYGATAQLVAGNATLVAGGNSVTEVRVDPGNDSHIVVVDSNPAGYSLVLYSTDAGTTWHTSTGTSSSDLFGSIAIDPVDGTHVVYVAGAPTLTVYVSTDGGATFTSTTPAPLQIVRRMMGASIDQLAPLKLRFGPPHPLYLHTMFGIPTSPMHVMIGADGTIAPQYTTSLEFNPSPPAGSQPILALATGFGLFASTDLGTTWTEIDGGSNATTISRRFAKIEWMNGYLYTATVGQGLLRSTQPLQ